MVAEGHADSEIIDVFEKIQSDYDPSDRKITGKHFRAEIKEARKANPKPARIIGQKRDYTSRGKSPATPEPIPFSLSADVTGSIPNELKGTSPIDVLMRLHGADARICFTTDRRDKSEEPVEGDKNLDFDQVLKVSDAAKHYGNKPEMFRRYFGVFMMVNEAVMDEIERREAENNLSIEEAKKLPGKRTPAKFKYCLLEGDAPTGLSPEMIEAQKLRQYLWLVGSRLPIAAMYDSGGRSIHALVKIDADSKEQFDERVSMVYAYAKNFPGIDGGRKSSAQLTRLPGAYRGGVCQALISWETGAVSYQDWIDSVPIDDGFPESGDLSTLLAIELEEPGHLIKNLIRLGQVGSLSGASKTYKSWTAMEMALAVCQGKQFARWGANLGPVFYVDTELEQYDFQSRMKAIISGGRYGEPDPCDFEHLLLRGMTFDIKQVVDYLIRKLRNREPGLIVIDAAYSLLGGIDENSNKGDDVAGYGNQLHRLAAATGSAVLFVLHFSKGSQDGKRGIEKSSGAGTWGRFVDFAIAIDKHTKDFHYNFEITTRTFAEDKPFVCQRINGHWEEVAGMDVARQQGADLTPFLHLLSAAKDCELSANNWMASMAAAKMPSSRDAFDNRLIKAIGLKLVEKVGSGPKTRYKLAEGIEFNESAGQYENRCDQADKLATTI
jgi:RecA-family ATPase